MEHVLTYATVCSGIECCSVAARGLPLRPVFFSEIEPFPCAVLKAHYPDVPNLGDMSKIQVSNDGKEITNGTVRIILDRRIDILAGGTPCQDISQAGKRRGMAKDSNTRSSLAFDFVRLASELRPRWVLWENVAGSIDSKNAPDFLRFASALGECGYTLAWRILDAQYVMCADIHAPDGGVDVPLARAVPQRRRRVWLLGMRTVGCLGADESVPAQILFEPDCVAGHTAPRRRTGEGFAYSLAGRDRVDAGVVGNAAERGDGGCLNPLDPQSKRLFTPDGPFHTVDAMNGGGGRLDGVCIALDGDKLKPREDQRKGGNGFGVNEDGAGCTLTAVDRHGVAYGIGNGQAAEASATIRECSQTLNCMHDKQATVQCYDMTHADDPGRKVADGVSPTLQSRMGTGGNQVPLTVSMAQNTRDEVRIIGGDGQIAGALPAEPGMKQQTYVVSTNSNGEDVAATLTRDLSQMRYIVRRLTPTEAERLMGLPSGYTIPRGLRITDELVAEFQRIHDTFGAIMAEYEHKPAPKPKSANQVRAWLEKVTNPDTCPDSPRYRVCGNGWATNQPRWILARLLALGENIDPFTGEEL